MRLSNRNKAGFYNFLNTFFLMLFVCGIAAFLLERYKFDIFGWESYIFLIVPALSLVIYYRAEDRFLNMTAMVKHSILKTEI